jgi:V8-like Glu-specific endopeptidase
MTELTEGIYGKDDRKDLYEISDPALLKLADSTVALVQSNHLRLDRSKHRYVPMTRWPALQDDDGESMCKDERFAKQPVLGSCSGALVGPDLVLTASHCVPYISGCEDVMVVFGFAVKAAGKPPQGFAEREVYRCKEVIGYGASDGADVAVFRLERAVTGHVPLKISRQGPVVPGTPLVMIGYPSGMPAKVAAGATAGGVGELPQLFLSDLDSFPGNSGSPVFNTRTGLIEGVLVRGAGSYEDASDRGCMAPVRCDGRGCELSSSVYVSHAAGWIP